MIVRPLALAAVMMLAACGGNDAPGDNNGSSAAADVDTAALSGEQLFSRCSACHQVKKDAPTGIGPNLHGVVGRAIASLDEYSYSPALRKKTGIWDEANLNAYMEAPRGFSPGNRMSFGGIKDAGERRALIDYLKEQK
ncbi:MAG: cytochrome c family protein [Sphingorhabdus sp.]